MKISELIKTLSGIKDKHGDLLVVTAACGLGVDGITCDETNVVGLVPNDDGNREFGVEGAYFIAREGEAEEYAVRLP